MFAYTVRNMISKIHSLLYSRHRGGARTGKAQGGRGGAGGGGGEKKKKLI